MKSKATANMPASMEKLLKIRNQASLISTASEAAKSGAAVLFIPIEKIVMKTQVRKTFDDQSIQELADSIESIGQQQPITVIAEEDRFRVVSGERRVRAIKLLKHDTVMAVLASADNEKDIAIAQLVENLQREDMSAYEIGQSFDSLIREGFFTIEELASKIGKNQRYVYKMLQTVKMPEELKDLMLSRTLNDADAIQKLVSLFSKNPDKKERLVELVREAAKNGNVSRSDVQRISDLIAAEVKVLKPRKRNESFMPLRDVEITPGNAALLKNHPAYSHYHFPGGNIRIECMFEVPNPDNESEGEFVHGAQLIPSILSDDPEVGVVEVQGKLYEVPWAYIHVLGVRQHTPKRFKSGDKAKAKAVSNPTAAAKEPVRKSEPESETATQPEIEPSEKSTQQ